MCADNWDTLVERSTLLLEEVEQLLLGTENVKEGKKLCMTAQGTEKNYMTAPMKLTKESNAMMRRVKQSVLFELLRQLIFLFRVL